MFEGSNKGLHIELGAGLVLTEVSETNFDFVAELGGFFFGFSDAGFVAFGKLDFGGVACTAGGWAEKSTEGFDEPNPVGTYTAEKFATGFNFFDPFVGGLFVPVVGDGTGENLDPEFFRGVGAEFGEGAGDTGERVNFKIVEGFDRQGFIFDQIEFGGIHNWVLFAIIDVVIVHFIDLDGRILGINLPFNEALEDFWYPDVEADLPASRDNLKAQMLLDAAGVFELFGVTQDTVKTGEKLLGG